MRWDDLNMADKSRMMQLAVRSGITDLRAIRDVYNSYAEGGPVDGESLINRVNTSDANFVQRLKDPNRKAIPFRNTSQVATHRMGYSTDDIGAIVYPEIQDINGELTDLGRPPYSKWAALDSAIERGDTLRMSVPEAEWFTENYKQYYPGFDQYAGGGFLGLFKKREPVDMGELPEVLIETPGYMNYYNAPVEMTKTLTNKNGKYNTTSLGDKGEAHFDVITARNRGLSSALDRAGFTQEEKERLTPFLLTQLVLEGGWITNRADNNFGGMKINGGEKNMQFENEDDFYDAYLANLDEKWGDNYLGKGKGWRNAKTIEDYANIINREDLKLHTKEAWEEYNRKHRDHPAYIYTPWWQNNNNGLMSENKFGGIYDRVVGNYELLNTRIKEWDKLARKNKIMSDQKALGGNLFGLGGKMGPINPKLLAHEASDILRSLIPKKLARNISESANSYTGLGNITKGLVSSFTNKDDRERLNYLEEEYPDPGYAFLLDDKRQRKYMEGMGYHLVDDTNYGMVDKATRNLMNKTGKAKIPIYQLGEDDIDPALAKLISTDPKIVNQYHVPTERQLNHASYHPRALYEDSEGNHYVKAWDLNDYGQHNGNIGTKFSDWIMGYNSKVPQTSGASYGANQFLAEMYDFIGNPFIQRTGLVKVKEPNERENEALEILKDALTNFRPSYKSGGTIHIKPENRGKFTALKKRTGKSAS